MRDLLSILLFLVISLGLIFLLKKAVDQKNEENRQRIIQLEKERLYLQRVNFLCSPGVYIAEFSHLNSRYAICLLKQDSKEFVVKEISNE